MAVCGSSARHAFVVDVGGALWSWGCNDCGQLGGSTGTAPRQVHWISQANVAEIALGAENSVFLDEKGKVWEIGMSPKGMSRRFQSTLGLPCIVSIAAGEFFAVAMDKSGGLWSWASCGRGFIDGQLGDRPTFLPHHPRRVSGLPAIHQFACGPTSTVAEASDGTLWTFGKQLGHRTWQIDSGQYRTEHCGAIKLSSAPPGPLRYLGAGESYVLAIDANRCIWTAGQHAFGVLGRENQSSEFQPVLGLSGVLQASAGWNHVLAREEDGRMWCWGFMGHKYPECQVALPKRLPELDLVHSFMRKRILSHHTGTWSHRTNPAQR